ncbi:MAG: DUF364 domain-containing protein [Bacteroidales bacterium]
MEKSMNGYEKDPLKFLLSKNAFDVHRIRQIVTGRKYTAVLSDEHTIGVCANFGAPVNTDKHHYSSIDPNTLSHRILLNAYFNSILNHVAPCFRDNGDIFDSIDFKHYEKIVMIGYFRPVAKKFKEKDIPLSIFDRRVCEEILTPYGHKEKHLKQADAVILTATSIFNGTFPEIIHTTKPACDIFVLGPSAIMSVELFQYNNIHAIFGATFRPGDQSVLKAIANGGGTRSFLRYGTKCILKNKHHIFA